MKFFKCQTLAEFILLESSIENIIFEVIRRNHGSQYKGSGRIQRTFSNVLQGTIKHTNIYFSTHFTDQISSRIEMNLDLTYSEYQEFISLFKSRVQACIKQINLKFPLDKLVEKEHCFLFWFPKTKDTFVVMIDKDFRHKDMNTLVFTTILPRRKDDSLPEKRSPNDIFITINE